MTKSRSVRLCLLLAFTCLAAAHLVAQTPGPAQGAGSAPAPPTPTDVQPGSITCEDVPYPRPVLYLPLTMYGQDVRVAFMDVAPAGPPNGRTVVLLHGNNFAGFYWGGPIDVLSKEGFRVVVPDQIGWGRSTARRSARIESDTRS